MDTTRTQVIFATDRAATGENQAVAWHPRTRINHGSNRGPRKYLVTPTVEQDVVDTGSVDHCPKARPDTKSPFDLEFQGRNNYEEVCPKAEEDEEIKRIYLQPLEEGRVSLYISTRNVQWTQRERRIKERDIERLTLFGEQQRPQLILLLRNHTRSQEADNGKLTQGRRRDTPLNFKHPRRDDKGRDPSSLKTSRRNQIESSENQTPTEFVPLQTRSRKSITANSQRDHHQRLAKETQAEGKSMSINGKESKLQRPANKTLEDKEEMERGKRCYRRGSRNLSHQRTTISDLPDLRTTLEVLPSHFKDKQLEKQKCRGDTHRPDRRDEDREETRLGKAKLDSVGFELNGCKFLLMRAHKMFG
ncbi:hypothetical protein HID58_067149 [Brassica napus]|uniref:Uncharacterized protein n=1 Tax=Brassica napus TaxID=3708 RepID=A0ABQ7ZHR1_BRANA|nr:hypothetical protein HID58_067149 [Brassica napus]